MLLGGDHEWMRLVLLGGPPIMANSGWRLDFCFCLDVV